VFHIVQPVSGLCIIKRSTSS